MNYILLNRFGVPTMRRIVAQMESNVSLRIRSYPTFREGDTCIRWACTNPIRFNGAKVINRADAISLACNKARSRMKMQTEYISVPYSFINDNNIIRFPCIARPFHHRKGENFNVINNIFEYEDFINQNGFENFYFSILIDKTNEYRVHVGHGKVLFINEKPLVSGEIRGNQHITGMGWGNVIPWNEYNKDMCLLACRAVQCLGLDMGAVDIIKSRDDGYYVCEVNTAPTLSASDTYSIQRYARYFDWIFRHNGGEWWNFSEWNQGKSFSWKNSQLEN